MKGPKPLVSLCLGFILTASCLVAGQAAKPANTEASCRSFVQAFYTWYLPKGSRSAGGRSWKDVVRYKSATFSPELFRQLKEDYAASAKNKDEIVGLDFDPILNSQDPCSRYVAEKVTAKGDGYLVEVFGVCEGKKSKTVDITPEVVFKDGQWMFVNFHYGTGKDENLLSILKQLRDDRAKKPGQQESVR